MNKCIVIGLDGGTWEIVEPLVKENKLPNIAKLMREGCWGNLISSIPPVTFPAWKCYSTGKNPGKIGIYWFINVDAEKRRFIVNNSRSCRSKEIWDYLSDREITCGIIEMPGTYPPKKIRGFIVCYGAPNPTNFTYPKELGVILREKIGYKLFPDCPLEADTDRYVEEVKSMIKQRFLAAKFMFKVFEPSFLHLTIFYTDTFQHFFWKMMEERDPKYGGVIEDIWRLVDEEIGRLLDIMDENTYVIIMSDHGFTAAKSTFQLAKWLLDRGYLVLKRKVATKKLISKIPLDGRDVLFLLYRLKLLTLIRRIIPRDLRSKIFGELFPPGGDVVERNSLEDLIDWEKSRVIPIPQGLTYINKTIFSSEDEIKSFRDLLMEEIRRIRNPRTGEYLAKRVYAVNELYSGERLDKAPDIIILPNEGYEIACSAMAKQLWYKPRKWTGVHKLKGIFIGKGLGIKEGVKIDDVSILDLAPTILHMFNIPIPRDMDGRVLTEVFNGQSEIAKRKVRYREIGE